MPLHLNLLHEEILEERQRRRDPLKLGILALIGLGAMMFLYYVWNAYGTLELKGRVTRIESEWKKIEPQVTAAQARTGELNMILSSTRLLSERIEHRFYWAPFLQTIALCVAPNTQLTTLNGSVNEETKTITVSIEGVAAGREPRAASEDLRQMLLEQLGRQYKDVKVEFKTLEDLDTLVNVGGANMPMARYTLGVELKNPNAPAPAPAPRAAKAEPKVETE